MYDHDDELDEEDDGDEGQMTGLMNATVINDGDDDFLDVSALNT
jgi:F-box and leucine-rich repeat protein GRR1